VRGTGGEGEKGGRREQEGKREVEKRCGKGVAEE